MNGKSGQPRLPLQAGISGPRSLRDYTPARVALNRAGSSIATAEILDFQVAHALARDSVLTDFAAETFAQRLGEELSFLPPATLSVLALKSLAPDRETYVRRPDLGRGLDPRSEQLLSSSRCEVVFVIADGLSAMAAQRNAIPLLGVLLPPLFSSGWKVGPICVIKNARVAIADQVGSLLEASLSVILLGERPGLSSHDSLGAYITWQPRPGRTDAERNCISNIRSGGLTHTAAATRILWYLTQSRRRRLTGTALKEQGPPPGLSQL